MCAQESVDANFVPIDYACLDNQLYSTSRERKIVQALAHKELIDLVVWLKSCMEISENNKGNIGGNFYKDFEANMKSVTKTKIRGNDYSWCINHQYHNINY
jgi:hypothetical protein